MQNSLKQVKAENDDLTKEKNRLQFQLKKMKDDLQQLIDKQDKKKQSLMKELTSLRYQEEQLRENRAQEEELFAKQHQQNQKRVDMLSQELDAKEFEIQQMQQALTVLNQKEMAQIGAFEQAISEK